MVILTLLNWLRSGQPKTVYMLPGFCDSYDPTTQNNYNCLIQLQPLQHRNNPSVAAKKFKEEFREYFSLEGKYKLAMGILHESKLNKNPFLYFG